MMRFFSEVCLSPDEDGALAPVAEDAAERGAGDD
jgi:hypothetical protein